MIPGVVDPATTAAVQVGRLDQSSLNAGLGDEFLPPNRFELSSWTADIHRTLRHRSQSSRGHSFPHTRSEPLSELFGVRVRYQTLHMAAMDEREQKDTVCALHAKTDNFDLGVADIRQLNDNEVEPLHEGRWERHCRTEFLVVR